MIAITSWDMGLSKCSNRPLQLITEPKLGKAMLVHSLFHKILPTYLQKLIWNLITLYEDKMGRAKRIWYLSPMRAAKVQVSLRIRAVSPEPLLLAHTSSESRGTFRQKARSLAPLNGWACAVNMCHDGMLEDTNSLDWAQMILPFEMH